MTGFTKGKGSREDHLQQRKKLRWRIVSALLIAAFLPLVLASFGSWVVFGRLIEKNSAERMKIVARSHANAIAAELTGNRQLLQLAAEAYDVGGINHRQALQVIFENLNRSSGGGFIDLGVIDDKGRHLVYIGPYDLQDKNYLEADWFKEVSVSGGCISDVFLGFRQVPHCIIAVRTVKKGRPYILRATIDSERFNRLVAAVPLGKGGAAYIVNREGLYQTTPMTGSVLDKSAIDNVSYHKGDREQRIAAGGSSRTRVTIWINDNRWMLVVEQDLAAVRGPVNQAIAAGASVVVAAILVLVVTTVFATWRLTTRIERANTERDEMSQAFLRSAKLASIGELATGLAHEINNPLAVISAEQTNISDLIGELTNSKSNHDEILASVERCKAQVQRCASITQKMLRFGRQQDTTIVPTDAAARLSETAQFMRRRAGIHNIEIRMSVDENLPKALVDPIELEQVLVNLINNAFDALPDGGTVTLAAHSDESRIHLDVSDDGVGIPASDIPHIFEPFFTSKEVGKGTGLGLAVCYGIIKSWGGEIDIESEEGRGTTAHILLPRWLGPNDGNTSQNRGSYHGT